MNYNLSTWVIDLKKHPENEAFYQTFLDVKNHLSDITKVSINDLRNNLSKQTSYLETIEKKYGSDSKDDSKLRYSAYLLLAQVYYFLDYPEKSIQVCEKLEKNGYYPEDAKEFKEASNKLLTKLKETNRTSRH
jgi:hypothetical protein